MITSTLAAGTTTYRDTGLTAATNYSYRVKATNAAGASAYSNTATTSTPAQSAVVFAESYPGADGSAWDPTRWTPDTQTTASLDVQASAGRMTFQNVSGAPAQATATMTKYADTETLLSFRFPSTGPRGYFYVFSRASGNWVSGYPGSSYFLQFQNDATSATLWKSEAGTTTSLATITNISAVTTAKQWLRFRVQGNTINAKVWTDGTTEPTTWELNTTNSAITAAGVLQVKWSRSSSATSPREVHLDDIQITRLTP